MNRIVVGILAHVDSGKTTLSEGLLYVSGRIRKLGRVDHGDAFLDNNEIERDRGITIFSKQAVINIGDTEFTLLDTPGHMDFSAETERTLQVLDYAILVVSASDGVCSHTETLWRLLGEHNIPVFIFVNKMDLPDTSAAELMAELNERLGDGFIDFSGGTQSAEFAENAAMCSEALMEEYLEDGAVTENSLRAAIRERNVFPCFFGSALKTEGVAEFADGLCKYTVMPGSGNGFGAKVFKISEDERGVRLTHMKITGGSLKVKEMLGTEPPEKVNEIRIYSGEKYTTAAEALPGMVCAVTGPAATYAGEGLGIVQNSDALTLEPLFTYSVGLPQGTSVQNALECFRKLEQEETQLNVLWNEQLQEINLRLMGEVQLEVLSRIIKERFGFEVEFEQGSIAYKETIENRVEGVGHYEPLRHYAEVHLLLEPGKRGSGIKISSKCSEDVLDRNWQRLILGALEEKTHLGVLTGSPVTDIKITLIAGKAHIKHTDGGDFRQATYRALRQGLMRAKNTLLEPWYSFTLEVPTEMIGRAMTDINRMGGSFDRPETIGERSVIKGSVAVSKICGYHKELTAYTHGAGRLFCVLKGYEPCAEAEEIIEEIGYSAEGDTENTPNSVFCSHGAGFTVKWDEVFDYMHLPAMNLDEPKTMGAPEARYRGGNSAAVSEDELIKIFEQTYGKIKRSLRNTMHTPKDNGYQSPRRAFTKKPKKGNYILVDGYNIIFAWEDLREIAKSDLDLARTTLINRLCAYRAMRNTEVIAVFDAYKVKGNPGSVEKVLNITVVYTREAQTADSYIEKAAHELGRDYNVRVATSDYMEQLIILAGGAFRISADEFRAEVEAAEEEIRGFTQRSE